MRKLCALVVLALGLPACPRQADPTRPDRGPSRRPLPPVAGKLVVGDLSFAGPAGRRGDATFMPGEVVTCLLSVSGFRHEQGKVDLRADVRVEGPEGELVLDQPDLELLSGTTASQRPGTIRSAAQLRISRAAPPGRQRLVIRIRDLLGGRNGAARAEFTLLGTSAPAQDHLQLDELHWAGGDESPPGGVLPAVFLVKGIATRKVAGRGHEIDLRVHSRLEAAGRVLGEQTETLLRGSLSFAPDAYPFEHQLAVPADAPPGSYQAIIEVQDRISDVKVRGRLALKVVPTRFGIWSIHLRDASGLSRRSFLLGEQTFVRFAVFGLRQRGEQLDASVDLAVAGPDGGVHLARQRAAAWSGAASKPFARAGRLSVQLPLIMPALAPTGPYRVVLRVRDHLSRKDVVAEQSFTLRGNAPPPLRDFSVTDLEVRERADLPPSKGDTFVLGRSYELGLVVGGLHPKELRKLTYAVAVEASLRLRSAAGAVVHERKGLFAYRRDLSYKPLRLQVPATWHVPVDLPPGLYDLEVEAFDPLGDRASQLRRRVELVRPAAGR